MSEPAPAKEIAELVLAELRPLLLEIANRMPLPGELAAINLGLGRALEQVAALAGKVEQLDTTARNAADNFGALVEEVRGYHTRTIDQYDHLGTRVHKLEERVKQPDEDGTKLAETGGE